MPHSPLERISSTSNINELARNITRQAITRCDQSHQSFHRHIISSSAVRSRVFLLIILSFPYRIFLKQLTMHYPGGVILSRPDPTSRSPRVSPEGAARAPPLTILARAPTTAARAPPPPPPHWVAPPPSPRLRGASPAPSLALRPIRSGRLGWAGRRHAPTGSGKVQGRRAREGGKMHGHVIKQHHASPIAVQP